MINIPKIQLKNANKSLSYLYSPYYGEYYINNTTIGNNTFELDRKDKK